VVLLLLRSKLLYTQYHYKLARLEHANEARSGLSQILTIQYIHTYNNHKTATVCTDQMPFLSPNQKCQTSQDVANYSLLYTRPTYTTARYLTIKIMQTIT